MLASPLRTLKKERSDVNRAGSKPQPLPQHAPRPKVFSKSSVHAPPKKEPQLTKYAQYLPIWALLEKLEQEKADTEVLQLSDMPQLVQTLKDKANEV